MRPFLKNIPYHITPLSPIHVGSGEEIDWTGSVLADNDMLLLVDAARAKLPAGVPEKIGKAALNAQSGDDLLELQRIFKDNRQYLAEAAYDSISLAAGVAKEFREKLGMAVKREGRGRGKSIINDLAIARCSHETHRPAPYIPGSSVKGAIRTAWLARLAQKRHVYNDKKLNEEQVLGGGFDLSPFRLLKIGDGMGSPEKVTHILHVQNCGRGNGKEKGVSVRLEVVPPLLHRQFRGNMAWQDLLGKASTQAPPRDELLRQVHDFHVALFEDQLQQLEKLEQVDKDWLRHLRMIKNELNPPHSVLIRIGKHATAESKTVGAELRKINVRVGKSKWEDKQNGTTFWLAEGMPMGWAVLEFGDTPADIPALQKFCGLRAEEIAAAAPVEIPETPKECMEFLKKDMQEETAIAVLQKAQKWDFDDKEDLDILLRDKNLGDAVEDLLEKLMEDCY